MSRAQTKKKNKMVATSRRMDLCVRTCGAHEMESKPWFPPLIVAYDRKSGVARMRHDRISLTWDVWTALRRTLCESLRENTLSGLHEAYCKLWRRSQAALWSRFCSKFHRSSISDTPFYWIRQIHFWSNSTHRTDSSKWVWIFKAMPSFANKHKFVGDWLIGICSQNPTEIENISCRMRGSWHSHFWNVFTKSYWNWKRKL